MRRTRLFASAALAAGLTLATAGTAAARPAVEDPAVSMWSQNPGQPGGRRSGRPARTRRTSPTAA